MFGRASKTPAPYAAAAEAPVLPPAASGSARRADARDSSRGRKKPKTTAKAGDEASSSGDGSPAFFSAPGTDAKNSRAVSPAPELAAGSNAMDTSGGPATAAQPPAGSGVVAGVLGPSGAPAAPPAEAPRGGQGDRDPLDRDRLDFLLSQFQKQCDIKNAKDSQELKDQLVANIEQRVAESQKSTHAFIAEVLSEHGESGKRQFTEMRLQTADVQEQTHVAEARHEAMQA